MKPQAVILNLAANDQAPQAPFALPEKDEALFREMLNAWSVRRLGALRHTQKAVQRDLAVVLEMTQFSGKAPWYWEEDDFERWSHEIGIGRKLAVSTQRHYQGVIRQFLEYLSANVKFRQDVRRVYGTDIRQICHAENCVPHVQDRELHHERPALTHDEITQLFDGLTAAIIQAHTFRSKDYYPLCRDKAMFFLMYACGLRISEARGLNVGSFQPNASLPALRGFGLVSVWGKGSKGSGPKHRLVPVTHTGVPDMLDWFLVKVRPWFLRNADPNEEALFLSERGNRIRLSTMEARFQHCIEIAGLSGQGFVPHCMRHSSVTHEAMRMSLEANRIKHGHVYSATTQGYTHIPDEFVQEEVQNAVNAQIAAALQSSKQRKTS